jgi:hypothetical protein
MATRPAPIVTTIDPPIKGRMPKRSSIGYHRTLNKLLRGTSVKVGNPSLSRKKKIIKTKTIAE